jgi:DNA-binding IscR family transcriptional regulator
MREGHSVEEVAREQRMSRVRLERILMALSKRRALSLKMG